MMTRLRPRLPPTVKQNAAGVFELMPGGVALCQVGDQMKTLLGSCVAVILTDPRRTVATMCHIVHVGQPNADNTGNTAYGLCAMEEMFARLLRIGVTPRFCHAYVYGGGNMFAQILNTRHVGTSNANWVLDFLHAQQIHVVNQDLGGQGYRKVSWTVGTDEPVVDNVIANV